MHVMLGQGGKRKKDTKKKEKSRKKKRKQKKQQRVSSNDTPQLEEQQQHNYAHVVYVCMCARGRTTARKTDGERARAQRGAVCDERVAGAASREVGRGTTRAATGVGGGRARWTSGYFKRRLFWHFAPSFPRAHPLASDRVLVSVSPRRQPQSLSQSVNRLIVGERLIDQWKDLGETSDNWKI